MKADDLYRRGREAMEADALGEAVGFFRSSIALWPHFRTLELLGGCFLRLVVTESTVNPEATSVTFVPAAQVPAPVSHASVAVLRQGLLWSEWEEKKDD